MFAGVGSTAALHYCTLPFVFEIDRLPDGRFAATRMDVLARRTTHEFDASDIVRAPSSIRPFVTFEVDGMPFFVTKHGFSSDADAATFGAQP